MVKEKRSAPHTGATPRLDGIPPPVLSRETERRVRRCEESLGTSIHRRLPVEDPAAIA